MNLLELHAAQWAESALGSITREYPNAPRHLTTADEDRPTPRQAHPAFYGCLDWHSCVEMHWTLVRLLRRAPDQVPAERIRAALDALLTPANLQAEADYLQAHAGWELPYGYGWALAFAAELLDWDDDPDARRWASALQPMTDVIRTGLLRWLPRLSHPVRHGMHANTAFALSRSRGFAAAHDPELLAAIDQHARRWFAADRDYPLRYDLCGTDFLSPALCEAQLMTQVLPDGRGWLERFAPDLTAPDSPLLEPVTVGDETDGQLAHLHGLNMSRAWCWQQLAAALPSGDPRIETMFAARDRHRDASLDRVTGSDYMVEHWLAAYAVLLLG